MFRKPREQDADKPSTGRPPTPPIGSTSSDPPAFNPSGSSLPTKSTPARASSTKKLIGTPKPKMPPKSTPSRTPLGGRKSFREKQGKPNASILSFFKKVEVEVGDGLFVAGHKDDVTPKTTRESGARDKENSLGGMDWDQHDKEVREMGEDGMKRGMEMMDTLMDAEPDFDDPEGLFGRSPIREQTNEDKDGERYNENEGANKRRRTSDGGASERLMGTGSAADKSVETPSQQEAVKEKKKPKRRGAFIDDSDSEDENRTVTPLTAEPSVETTNGMIEPNAKSTDVSESDAAPKKKPKTNGVFKGKGKSTTPSASDSEPSKKPARTNGLFKSKGKSPTVPALKYEPTSLSLGTLAPQQDSAHASPLDSPSIPNDYADGEEMVERKWMEEQDRAMFESGELDEGVAKRWDPGEWEGCFEDAEGVGVDGDEMADGIEEVKCPICDADLVGVVEKDVERHVNGCLDGKPVPVEKLARVKAEVETKPELTREDSSMPPLNRSDSCSTTPIPESNPKKHPSQRFSKAALPKPGQKNPLSLTTPSTSNGKTTAFSALMTGNAESSAWKEAAAAESSARGKPAAQRTCPFYKILPGFNICVDAFRYGKVEGCEAYFLSHFHSDHYVGLSGSWCHGPIYASTITARLCVQQLKVDPKWMRPIAFDERVEIPGTNGVTVTMIPANHCPGSSLFLYEKAVCAGPNPRVHRVLHCGDFRACPEHIKHPLLMPDVVDKATAKLKHQRIDVCYLDTTYLNPKYAFPSQEAVIKSCADMCVSLSKDVPDPGDAWEVAKRERAGKGMTKFVEGNITVKEEDGEVISPSGPSTSSTTTTNGTKPKSRGRLLVVCGTYSIGKERICLGIARALNCKIYAPPNKRKICSALEDPELMERLTDDPLEAQVHMQMIMEIRPETLADYLTGFKKEGGFTRIVGFRPSGWNYRPPSNRFLESPAVDTVLYGGNWKSGFSMHDMVPQRGSTREAGCYGVPYSEHSSFRELTMFVSGLRIEKIIPTVNVGSEKSRQKMGVWIERWLAERRKNGVCRFGSGEGEVRW